MKASSFFKILNRKIKMYDKIATNPFTEPRNVVIIWVEEPDLKKSDGLKEKD